MLFSSANHMNAITYPFNWNADYYDGSYYSEFDLSSHKKNDFYLIQRDKTIRFGLFGQNMKFYFENDGSFNLKGRRIEIEYHKYNGEIISLTTNFNKKDLITYKEAYTDYSNKQGIQKSNLKSINFGYKTKIKNGDMELFFQPIVSLPFSSSAYIEVKLTSNISDDGQLVFKSRGMEIQRFDAPLLENLSMQMNWTIK